MDENVSVPREPTEAMWSGLARELVQWCRFPQLPTGEQLYKHLRSLGRDIPDWLLKEIPDTNAVPPKGTVAACIYKAMIAEAPVSIAPASPPSSVGEEARASKYTLGPWIADHYSVKLADHPQAWHVAECHHGLGAPDHEAFANVRLIAAAPELLEALTELISANSYYFPSGNPWGDKARAVIAKATTPDPRSLLQEDAKR